MYRKTGLVIVTYGTNFGTYLQAFATQYIIRKLGYETEIINVESVQAEVGKARNKYFLSQIFNFSEIRSYARVFAGIACQILNKKYRRYIQARKKKFNEFRKERFQFAPVCKSWEGLTEYCSENYNNVVVGSDQLWRPANIAGNFYTLNFVPKEINKIAYATSFGLKEIRRNQTETAKTFLSRIEHLSTREVTGAEIIRICTSRKVPVVVDPTLVLSSDEWLEIIPKKPIVEGKYILCYLLGSNKKHRDFVKRLAHETGCRIIGVLHVAGYINGDDETVDEAVPDVGPIEFLNLIKNAEYVCTDSFHGCVFAIQFVRKMFAFKRFADNDKMSTNDRIFTLLSKLNMEQNLLSGEENISDCLCITNDHSHIAEELEYNRNQAYEYLKKAFANEETDL